MLKNILEYTLVMLIISCLLLFLDAGITDEKAQTQKEEFVYNSLTHLQDYIDQTNRYDRVWFDGIEREVRITAYNPVQGQTDGRHWENANGTKVRNMGIALSRDLLTNYGGGPYTKGDTIFVVVPFVVEDTMAKKNKRRADILIERKYAALLWGVKNAWIIK